MDDHSKSLWSRVCATVNKLGGPRSPRPTAVEAPQEATEIDLHGLAVQEAHRRVAAFLRRSTANSVTVITGRSGVIRAEFPFWLEQMGRVKSYEEQNGGGAFIVTLRHSK